MFPLSDPEAMTSAERRSEIANILAQGLLRGVRADRLRAVAREHSAPELSQIPLDLSAKTRLSVAPRPPVNGRVSEPAAKGAA